MPFRLQALSPTDHVSGRYIMGDYLARNPSYGAELDILLLDDTRVRVQGNTLKEFGAPRNTMSVMSMAPQNTKEIKSTI